MSEQSSDLQYLEYEKTKDGVVVTWYNGDPETVVIPDTIDGAPVVRIKVGAFARRANRRSITLPQGLTEIQDFAFCDSFNLRFVRSDAFRCLAMLHHLTGSVQSNLRDGHFVILRNHSHRFIRRAAPERLHLLIEILRADLYDNASGI